jgi:hypothetical protein
VIHIKIVHGRFVSCWPMPPIQPEQRDLLWPQYLRVPLLRFTGHPLSNDNNIAAYKADHAE